MTTAAVASRENSSMLFATPAIVANRRVDGSIIVKSTVPLQPAARCVGDWLEHWARQTPAKIFLGERAKADAPWTTVTYSDALRQVRSAASWILAQGLSAQRPLVSFCPTTASITRCWRWRPCMPAYRRRRSRRPIR